MFKAMATNHFRGSQLRVQPNNKFSTSLTFRVHKNLIFRRTVYKDVTDIYARTHTHTHIHTYIHT